MQIFNDTAVVLFVGSALFVESLIYGFCHEQKDCFSFSLEGQSSLPFFIDDIRNVS